MSSLTLVLIRDKCPVLFRSAEPHSFTAAFSSVLGWRWDGFEIRENSWALAQCIEALCSRGAIHNSSFQLHMNDGEFTIVHSWTDSKAGMKLELLSMLKLPKTGSLVVVWGASVAVSAFKCLRGLQWTRTTAQDKLQRAQTPFTLWKD